MISLWLCWHVITLIVPSAVLDCWVWRLASSTWQYNVGSLYRLGQTVLLSGSWDLSNKNANSFIWKMVFERLSANKTCSVYFSFFSVCFGSDFDQWMCPGCFCMWWHWLIPVTCASVSVTLFTCPLVYFSMFGDMKTARCFSNDLLCLALLAESVSDCPLDDCQVFTQQFIL